MVKGLFEPIVSTLERTLDVRQAQHALTASNLANADTPHYKAQEIPVREVLDGEWTAGDIELTRTDARHLDASGVQGANETLFPVRTLEAPPWSLDGNSVVLERETARLISNSISYSGVSLGLSRKLAALKFASSDGRS